MSESRRRAERVGGRVAGGRGATPRLHSRRKVVLRIALALALVGSTVSRGARAEGPAPSEGRSLSPEQHRQVLLRTFEKNRYGQWAELLTPGFLGAVWTLAGVAVLAAPREFLRAKDGDPPPAPPYTDGVAVGGAGLAVAAAIGTYFVPDEYVRHGSAMAISQTVATWGLFNYLHVWDSEPATRASFLGAVGTGLSLSGIVFYDALVARPTSWTKVRSVQRRLAAAGPSELSERIAEAEAEVASAANHVPFWVPLSVILAGFAVQVSPSFISGVPADERQYAAIMAGVSSLVAYNSVQALYAMDPLPQMYRELLRAATLAPVGPEGSLGVSLVGRF